MSKKDNPILNILVAQGDRVARDVQAGENVAELQQRLCNWIREAELTNIKISARQHAGIWVEVERPHGPAYVCCEPDNGPSRLCEIFHDRLKSNMVKDLEDIVQALEKGTAHISRK